ncbi:Xylose isomerase-type TIM barrel domain protein [Candidatus Magnetomorum sp. HK-1]|nr:Xylose isomerase-type TIM barrel domain protein [Candidatus Magnetomorum sp. HK-1]
MIYISSSCFRKNKITEALDLALKYDFKNIELSGGSQYYESCIEDLLKYKKKYEFNYLVHNYFPPPENHFILNISSQNKSLRQKSVEFSKNSIKVSALLGSPMYTIHTGYMTDLHLSHDGEYFLPDHDYNNTHKDISIKYLIESVEILCEYASTLNVKIGLENLFPENSTQNFSLMCTFEDIEEILSYFSSLKNLGILLDLGHAYLSSKLLSFNLKSFLNDLMLRYKEKVLEIHLSDNDGKKDIHLVPEINSWMDQFIIKESLRSIPITIESRGSDLKSIRKYTDFLNRKLMK